MEINSTNENQKSKVFFGLKLNIIPIKEIMIAKSINNHIEKSYILEKVNISLSYTNGSAFPINI